MMLHFVTHFDSNYVPQARVMLESLLRHVSEPIVISCVFLDGRDKYKPILDILKTANQVFDSKTCSLDEFVETDSRLQAARQNRSWQEFCWTLEPAIVNRVLEESTDGWRVVYVDADSYFLRDPIPAIQNLLCRNLVIGGHPRIGLTPHHFPPGQESRERTVGRYNFGFGLFENCVPVRGLVEDWLARTLDKCQAGGQNDQTYLDDWQTTGIVADFERGVNVGPWQNRAIINHGEDGLGFHAPGIPGGVMEYFSPLVSYHFHEFRRGPGRNPVLLRQEGNMLFENWNRTNYDIRPETIQNVYEPYERELEKWL